MLDSKHLCELRLEHHDSQVTVILIDLPYSDPPFAAISIETSVPVKILFANHIEMNQVKMSDIMRIAR